MLLCQSKELALMHVVWLNTFDALSLSLTTPKTINRNAVSIIGDPKARRLSLIDDILNTGEAAHENAW